MVVWEAAKFEVTCYTARELTQAPTGLSHTTLEEPRETYLELNVLLQEMYLTLRTYNIKEPKKTAIRLGITEKETQ